MEKLDMILKAPTHDGFGSPDFYEDEVVIDNTPEAIKRALIDFALKYNVEYKSIVFEFVND